MERATRQHPFASFVGGLWMLLIVGLSFVGGADNSRPDKVKTDGPVGAISVHLVCGVFGAICVGLFAQAEFTLNTTGNGLFFGGGAGFLMAQLPTNSWIKLFSLQLGCSWLGTLKTVFKLEEDTR